MASTSIGIKIHEEAALAAIKDFEPVVHMVQNPNTSEYGHFYVFVDVGVVNWTTNGANPNYNHTLMTIEAGHELWASCMEQGYRPVLADSEVSA